MRQTRKRKLTRDLANVGFVERVTGKKRLGGFLFWTMTRPVFVLLNSKSHFLPRARNRWFSVCLVEKGLNVFGARCRLLFPSLFKGRTSKLGCHRAWRPWPERGSKVCVRVCVRAGVRGQPVYWTLSICVTLSGWAG